MKKLLIVAGLAMALSLTGCSMPKLGGAKTLSQDEAKQKAVDFINGNLVQPGTKVQIDSISEEGSLYKIEVSLSSSKDKVISYISKDGTKFFPQSMDIKGVEDNNAGNKARDNAQADQKQKAPAAEVSKKSDKPVVEAFVMSYCPYGTQIEKGLLPVAKLLGKKIDFSVKFCDYAMHGEKEIQENMRQVCIQKLENGKYFDYLGLFLQDSAKAVEDLKTAKIDSTKIDACMKDLDSKYSIMKKFNDKSTWSNGSYPPFDVHKDENSKYGVQGSPTLVINGEEVQAGRDSQSLLKAICSAFNKQPDECKKTLSSDNPAPGFGGGTDTSGSGSAAGCASN